MGAKFPSSPSSSPSKIEGFLNAISGGEEKSFIRTNTIKGLSTLKWETQKQSWDEIENNLRILFWEKSQIELMNYLQNGWERAFNKALILLEDKNLRNTFLENYLIKIDVKVCPMPPLKDLIEKADRMEIEMLRKKNILKRVTKVLLSFKLDNIDEADVQKKVSAYIKDLKNTDKDICSISNFKQVFWDVLDFNDEKLIQLAKWNIRSLLDVAQLEIKEDKRKVNNKIAYILSDDIKKDFEKLIKKWGITKNEFEDFKKRATALWKKSSKKTEVLNKLFSKLREYVWQESIVRTKKATVQTFDDTIVKEIINKKTTGKDAVEKLGNNKEYWEKIEAITLFKKQEEDKIEKLSNSVRVDNKVIQDTAKSDDISQVNTFYDIWLQRFKDKKSLSIFNAYRKDISIQDAKDSQEIDISQLSYNLTIATYTPELWSPLTSTEAPDIPAGKLWEYNRKASVVAQEAEKKRGMSKDISKAFNEKDDKEDTVTLSINNRDYSWREISDSDGNVTYTAYDNESTLILQGAWEKERTRIILTEKEKDVLKANPKEFLKGMIEFRKNLKKANLLNLWDIRDEIYRVFTKMSWGTFSITSNYLSIKSQKYFFSTLIESCMSQSDTDRIRGLMYNVIAQGKDNSSNINSMIHLIRQINSATITHGKKQVNTNGDSLIWERFRKRFIPRKNFLWIIDYKKLQEVITAKWKWYISIDAFSSKSQEWLEELWVVERIF